MGIITAAEWFLCNSRMVSKRRCHSASNNNNTIDFITKMFSKFYFEPDNSTKESHLNLQVSMIIGIRIRECIQMHNQNVLHDTPFWTEIRKHKNVSIASFQTTLLVILYGDTESASDSVEHFPFCTNGWLELFMFISYLLWTILITFELIVIIHQSCISAPPFLALAELRDALPYVNLFELRSLFTRIRNSDCSI